MEPDAAATNFSIIARPGLIKLLRKKRIPIAFVKAAACSFLAEGDRMVRDKNKFMLTPGQIFSV